MAPQEFQTIAEELLSRGGPAGNRSAIGRAYYALLNVAVGILEAHVAMRLPSGPAKHGEVMRHLMESGNAGMKELGRKLSELRSMRNHADYDLDDLRPEQDGTAKIYVTGARRSISAIEGAFAGPEREAIVDGIKKYRAKIALGRG